MTLGPDRLDRTLHQLQAVLTDLHTARDRTVPTIAEYLARVKAAAGPGARRTYGRDLIVSAGDSGAIRIWDPEAGADVGPTSTGHAGGVAALAVSRCRELTDAR
jgi:hypothetical protein